MGEKWKNKREMLFCEGARVYVAVGSVWNHVAGDGRVSAFCFCPASGGISFFRSVVMFLLCSIDEPNEMSNRSAKYY